MKEGDEVLVRGRIHGFHVAHGGLKAAEVDLYDVPYRLSFFLKDLVPVPCRYNCQDGIIGQRFRDGRPVTCSCQAGRNLKAANPDWLVLEST